MMTFAERIYRITHKKDLASGGKVPYYWKYSILTIIAKPTRKFFSAVVIPIIPFNNIRILLYRLCGYKIGKNVFIGMRCYLDDMCYDQITIGDNVGISYGVYFACHGQRQNHHSIVIKNNTHIGMRAMILAREDIVIGSNCMIGTGSLVNKSVPDNSVAVGVPFRILPPKNSENQSTHNATRTWAGGGKYLIHNRLTGLCNKHKNREFYAVKLTISNLAA